MQLEDVDVRQDARRRRAASQGNSPQGLQPGFTLIELLIVMAIVTIIFLIATPNYDSVIVGNKVKQQKYEIATSLAMARTEAVKRGALVRVTCVGSGCASGDWSGGWKVAPVGDADIHVEQGVAANTTLKYDCGAFIEFDPAGARSSSSVDECIFTAGKKGGTEYDTKLSIGLQGRVQLDYTE